MRKLGQKKELSIGEAAHLLGVSRKTLRRWEKRGLVSPRRTRGGQRRYRLSAMEELARRKEVIHVALRQETVDDKSSRGKARKGAELYTTNEGKNAKEMGEGVGVAPAVNGQVMGRNGDLTEMEALLKRWQGKEPVKRQFWALPLVIPLVIVLVVGIYRHAPEELVTRRDLVQHWRERQATIAETLFENLGFESRVVAGDESENGVLGAETSGAGTVHTGLFGEERVASGSARSWVGVSEIEESSEVFIQFDTTRDGIAYEVTKIIGEGFWVDLEEPIPQDEKFEWWVVKSGSQ